MPAALLLDQERARSLDGGEQGPAAGKPRWAGFSSPPSRGGTRWAGAGLARPPGHCAPHRPLSCWFPHTKGARMMLPSPRPHLRNCPQGLYVYGKSRRGALRGAHRWQGWRTRGLVSLALSGLLLLGAMVLSQPLSSPGAQSPVPQAVPATPLII